MFLYDAIPLFSCRRSLQYRPCEVGRALLSRLAGKPSCCSSYFGEKGCLSSREAHWLKHFANRCEFKSTWRAAEKESPTQGGARAFSGCCRGLGTGSNAGSWGRVTHKCVKGWTKVTAGGFGVSMPICLSPSSPLLNSEQALYFTFLFILKAFAISILV